MLFFFFKQKTAYEMRIRDWSSDVCSSDLLGDIVLGHEPAVMPPRDLSRPVQDALEVPGDPAAGPPDALGERGFGEMVGLLHPHAAGQRADQALRGLARLP